MQYVPMQRREELCLLRGGEGKNGGNVHISTEPGPPGPDTSPPLEVV